MAITIYDVSATIYMYLSRAQNSNFHAHLFGHVYIMPIAAFMHMYACRYEIDYHDLDCVSSRVQNRFPNLLCTLGIMDTQ